MRGGILHHASAVRRAKPLAVRASLGRTFGSMAGFLAMIFLAGGIYILEDAFAHPSDAQAAGLITAAFVIALAALLFFYLFKPRRIAGAADWQTSRDSTSPVAESVIRAPAGSVPGDDLRKDLAYQRIYVDHSRIRP